jgi:homoserine kinase
MPAVVSAARTAGALGCVLSGAGPSLLAVAPGVAEGEAVATAMEKALDRAGVRGAARTLAVDTRGAVVREETS